MAIKMNDKKMTTDKVVFVADDGGLEMQWVSSLYGPMHALYDITKAI